MSDGIPGKTSLLRFVSPAPAFLGDDKRPSWRALRPSPEDLEQATNAGAPVRVTVWDRSSISIVQAEAFLPPKVRLYFALTADDVAAASAHWKMPEVKVVREPITTGSHASLPGASAHCGIEGLERKDTPKESDKAWGIRLSFLAARLVPASD